MDDGGVHLLLTGPSGNGEHEIRRPTSDSQVMKALLQDETSQFHKPMQQRLSHQQAVQADPSFGALGLGSYSGLQQQHPTLSHCDLPTSLPSTVSMLPIPSMCMLDSQYLRPMDDVITSRSQCATSAAARNHANDRMSPTANATGLGLTLSQSAASHQTKAQADQPQPGQGSPFGDSQPQLSSTISSVSGHRPRVSPSRAFMQSIMEHRRAVPALEIHDAILDPTNPEDVLGSATEVATPSITNTPDLRTVEQTVTAAKDLTEWLTKSLADAARSNSIAADDGHQRATTPEVPASPRESFPGMGQVVSPPSNSPVVKIQSALTKLGSHLSMLQSYVNTYPSLSGSIKVLAERIDNLESMSFNNVHGDEVADRFEHLDGRLLDIEHWREDHDKHHAAIDADNSVRGQMVKYTGNGLAGSLTSTHSFEGNGDLIPASRDEIQGIKERLEDLEATLPSSNNPWDIEVVFLPWGPNLKGIWTISGESQSWKASTADTEEWTQARTLLSSKGSGPLTASFHSGWSNEDIAGWADHATEWLSPKACGTKNLTYQRLQSRGFVRIVRIMSQNASDIQAALARAFEPISDFLRSESQYESGDHDVAEQMAMDELPGLRAKFIPLRKVLHSSRLRFLSRSEMATSALWSAQFLSSGVLMRVTGGVKRLYVTQRHSYLQQTFGDTKCVWQRLRELPRVKLTEGNHEMSDEDDDQEVTESDALEACWAYSPILDTPNKPASSMSSIQSHFLSDRATSPSIRSSISQVNARTPSGKTPRLSEGSDYRRIRQPITPTSEFPQYQRVRRRARTASASLVDDRLGVNLEAAPPERRSWSGKRLLTSSQGHLSNTASASRTVTTLPLSSKSVKRRRLSRSLDEEHRDIATGIGPYAPVESFDEQEDSGGEFDDDGPVSVTFTSRNAFNYTPRRSREPTSPFFEASTSRAQVESRKVSGGPGSAHSGLAGPNVKGGSTPHAYATPYSGTGGFGVGRGQFEYDGDTEVDEISNGDSSDEWDGLEGEDEHEHEQQKSDQNGMEPGVSRSFRSDDEESGFGFGDEDETEQNESSDGHDDGDFELEDEDDYDRNDESGNDTS